MYDLSNVLKIIKPLYSVDELEGYSDDEIELLKQQFGVLPSVLEVYYRIAGKTDAFLHGQDNWMLPEHFQKWKWLHASDYLVLLNENQGVCRAGIHRKDLHLSDPPVAITDDDKVWTLCTPSTSEFLAAALTYEAVFTLEYNPEEFYWVTKDEMKFLQLRLLKYPFELQRWVGDMRISFYYNSPDNLVVIMDGGDLQMLYGAANETAYEKLLAVVKDIGEPM